MDVRDLLPNQDYEVEGVGCDEDDGHVQLSLRPSTECASCSCCQTHRVHSWYQRYLRDISWGGRKVEIGLKVRRFFCDKADCPRKIFAERLSGLPARTTHGTLGQPHAATWLIVWQDNGREDSGAIADHDQPLDMLRDVSKAVVAADYTPRVLGVDDWAM